MTISAVSLAAGAEGEGFGGPISFDITSVDAPANSVLALWLAASPDEEPSVSGLDLTWTVYASKTNPSGNLYLLTTTVGGTAVSGGTISVSYSGAPAVGWDLDCISGDDGETPALGVPASGAVTAENETDSSTDVTVTMDGGPVFYLFGSAAYEGPEYSGAPGESPAWTELARVFPTTTSPLYWALGLGTQVSPDASNPVAKADWGWSGFGYWCAIGVPVSG